MGVSGKKLPVVHFALLNLLHVSEFHGNSSGGSESLMKNDQGPHYWCAVKGGK